MVGDVIETETVGEWPGGVCMTVELTPDPAAPEILFNVENADGWVMGVFENEWVRPIRRANANLGQPSRGAHA